MTNVSLPDRSPGLYDSFAAVLREWKGHPVAVRNSGDAMAIRDPALLSDVQSSHLVILAALNRAFLPFTSIEMVYSDQPPTVANAVLTIVVRR